MRDIYELYAGGGEEVQRVDEGRAHDAEDVLDLVHGQRLHQRLAGSAFHSDITRNL
jgi:hypothetical protein